MLAAVMFTAAVSSGPARAEDARADWRALNGRVAEAYQEGRYAEGIGLAEGSVRSCATAPGR